MKYLKGIDCEKCGKKFFVLAQEEASPSQPEMDNSETSHLCGGCLQVEKVPDELQGGIKEVLSLYDDSPSKGRYRIEEID